MPIYEYKCSECDSRFEKMRKVSDPPLQVCENCGGNLEKQWSLSGFQFKGEGWYVTDYAGKKNGAEKPEKAEKSEKAEKNSASDSTEKPKAASKEKSESSSDAKQDTVSKKE